ncbi:MAG: putative drug exporter of the superfamily, partial [Pseudonocardiales bacterium]|nr:putative drug exporter of the superfamily [Pseudonocardiales bacterium]
MFGRIADLTWKYPKRVLAGVALFTVLAAGVGHSVEKHLKAAGFTDSSSESERAIAVLRNNLGYDATPGLVVLVRAPGGGTLDLADPKTKAEVGRIKGELAHTDFVGKANGPLPAKDGRSVVLLGHLSTQDLEEDGGKAAEDAKSKITSDRLDVGIGGFAPSFNEVNDQTRTDLTKAELIAFPLLTILLLIVFRGVIAASIPLVIGVISILGSFLLLRVMSLFVDTSLFALNISTGLSLGLAVDYALLMVTRYREELERDGPSREAHRRMVVSAGRTVVFSGFTVAAAMAALTLFPQRFLYSVGVAGASVGVLASLVALFGVSAVLALLGNRINSLAVRKGRSVADE